MSRIEHHTPVFDYSEIYQVTGPVERFAGQIASQGYVVGACKCPNDCCNMFVDACPACPSTYHEFEGPEPIPYDVEGKDISYNVYHGKLTVCRYRQGQ